MGVNDHLENLLGTDPTSTLPPTPPSSVTSPFTAAPLRIGNESLDKRSNSSGTPRPRRTSLPNIWNEDQLISFAVRNTVSTDWRNFRHGIAFTSGGSLSYLFHSEYGSGFSYPGQPSSALWDAGLQPHAG